MARVKAFFADPVTRFWFGCNVFCVFFLFIGFFLGMTFIYPVFIRPITKY